LAVSIDEKAAMSICAVIVAAGVGARAGPGEAKQWRSLAGRPVVRWSAEALLGAGVGELVVVVAAGQEGRAAEALAGLTGWTLAAGGAARSDSVKAGLAALTGPDEALVLIHDAARPLLKREHVERLVAAVMAHGAAILALPLADTLKREDGSGRIAGTPPRAGLWRAQTPQGFRLGKLRAAYAAWPAGEEPTDEAMVIERAGGVVALVPGDPALAKLTYPEDFAMAEQLAGAARVMRIGQGLDAHRFGPGDGVMLCGVHIAHDRALIGHSDADAGLHALTDALLGAIGEGDIGDHFPPSDPKWRGAASDLFLAHAAGLVTGRGGRIVNVDVTLICERPRIKPHREAMRMRLAALLGLDLSAVSVKATTLEGMGFTGREEGLAAQAVAMVELPA
jgi:2-C-methyl-D-erythritol 4-phosphate cytidylyltransferase/2-C-methyl-D-erythritol 2,4-cyclodiphosphate synthase